MSMTFNFFKTKYPNKVKFRDLTAAELEFAKTNFPGDLSAFLEEEGYSSFGDGFFHFVDPGDYKDALAEWNNVSEGHLVFGRTGIGDLVTWSAGKVYILHVNQGTFNDISTDMFNFFTFVLGDDGYVNKTLFKKQFDQAKKKLGSLNYDECYAFVPALPMGGEASANNLRKAKIMEYLSILAQLHS